MSSTPVSTSPEAAIALLQLVVDTLPQFIFWKDRESVYLGCNENFARVAGLNHPREVVGKTDFELAWTREQAEFFRLVDQRVMESGAPEYHIVEPQLQSDGKQAWLETNKIPLKNAAGEVTGILGTFEDVTQRKLEQEASHHARRLESIGKLAGGVAHDFNNLLGGIIGAAELLQRRNSNAQDQELLEEILRTSERAADLTGKLLAFSRRGNVREEVVDLHEAIDNVAPLLRRGLDARLQVEFELLAELPLISGDASEVELALLNLGLNARDAMPQGGTLKISTSNRNWTEQECAASHFELAPGRYVRITVEDTGTGIAPDIVDRVFEPFFTTKAVGAGTGLGLAAVYGAVVAHKGSIVIDRARSVGAGFVIDLPQVVGERLPTALEEAPFLLPQPGLVLVVDDEPLLRKTIGERLKRLGFTPVVAGSGEEGLALFQERPTEFSLVVMDVVMPGMGGVECVRRIREIAPSVAVILSSGFTREQLMGREEHTKHMAFLKKPYAHAALLSAVETALLLSKELAQSL